MAASLAQLIIPTQLTNATADYYVADMTTRVDDMTITNPTGTARTVTIYLSPSAGTAGDAQTIVSARSVNAGETYIVGPMLGKVMIAGDIIRAKASAGTALTISASGLKFSL